MGGKEKAPRPARAMKSGQEANKKRVAKAAGVRTGKRDQTKRAKAERATVLQEKEERSKSTINIILDEGKKKSRCQSLPLREPSQTRKKNGGGTSTLPSSPGFPPCASLEGYRSRATRGANVHLTRLAAARSQIPLCSCGMMAKCVSFSHVLMRRTVWKQTTYLARGLPFRACLPIALLPTGSSHRHVGEAHTLGRHPIAAQWSLAPCCCQPRQLYIRPPCCTGEVACQACAWWESWRARQGTGPSTSPLPGLAGFS